jgi:hypothetical protein
VKIALVNTNLIKPPIAPIGLEYTAEALAAQGHEIEILDLAWEEDVDFAIESFFRRCDAGLIGVTLRNTDDCAFTTRHSFLDGFASIIRRIRQCTDGFIVLGGVGFSVMPKKVLEAADADAGIRGEGEFVFPLLAERLQQGKSLADLPGILIREDGAWRENPVRFGDVTKLPPMRRNRFDNVRYFREGGQAGVETSRGCHMPCTFCADPVAKGRTVRTRPHGAVADEIEALLSQGIDHFHTCDSEFNLDEAHAASVCEALIARGLGSRVRWYAYCTPLPFSEKTARLMARAGCVGINFSVDHGDPGMLKRLGRAFSPEHILDIALWCKNVGIAVMFDLLLGSQGETRETAIRAMDLMKQSSADRIGISLGLRVWPETKIADELLLPSPASGLVGGSDPTKPLFFLEPKSAADLADWIEAGIGNDPRFLFFNPKNASKNYNYSENRILVEAVKAGHRGAYWDILRRLDA